METSSSFERKSRNKQTVTALSSQKPYRKTRKKFRSYIFKGMKLLFYFSIFYILIANRDQFYGNINLESGLQTHVSPLEKFILIDQDGKIEEKEKTTIHLFLKNNIAKSIDKGRELTPEFLANEVQKNFNLSTCTAIQLSSGETFLIFKKRTPFLTIKDSSLPAAISTEGEVYEQNSDEVSSKIPSLFGLLQNRKHHPVVNQDRTLLLSSEEESIAQNAVTLTKKVMEQGISIHKLEFRTFRGFSIFIEEDDIEVSIGLAPFDEKLLKLNALLKNIRAKGLHSKKIEIDYEGKAFLTEQDTEDKTDSFSKKQEKEEKEERIY